MGAIMSARFFILVLSLLALFQEKQISQKAHGRQELAFSPNGHAYDAKRCVDMWLKMPGNVSFVLEFWTRIHEMSRRRNADLGSKVISIVTPRHLMNGPN